MHSTICAESFRVHDLAWFLLYLRMSTRCSSPSYRPSPAASTAASPASPTAAAASASPFALIHLARALNDANMHELALCALRREDRLFNPEIGLWPDTRMDEPQYSLGWCNGAVGFLLARAEAWDDLEAWQREHVRSAFARIVEWFGRLEDDSLCHGTVGGAVWGGCRQESLLFRLEPR
ncbi:lanthionine synthetase LanC family protein [Lysobacter sp. CA196]|uniref:lanthionine synthetase LanC family protein n=1 Tax=Lysobacter sp. CA196 TaxID=3455606 RepID=UPI003F8D11AB